MPIQIGRSGSSAQLSPNPAPVLLNSPIVQTDVVRRIDINQHVCGNAAAALTIPTYDGSGQTVEPSVVYIPEGWNGHQWWACITPYPGSDATKENPSIYYSDDGQTWAVPVGLTNPIAAQPLPSGGNGDPEILLGPDGLLHVFFIQSLDKTLGTPVWSWMHTQSADGVTWTTPTAMWSTTTAMSPTGGCVLFDGTHWNLWFTDCQSTNTVMYRLQSTSLTSGWDLTTKQACTLSGFPAGRHPWEQHACWHGEQMVMVLTSQASSGTTFQLEILTSLDGLTWTCATTPLLSPSTSGWDSSLIYRADIVKLDKGGGVARFGVYYSAKKTSDGTWHTGYTEVTFPDADRQPNVQTFTASGTWTKLPGAQTVDVVLIGPGGGGGAGARGPSGTALAGGAGGGGGAISMLRVPASQLTSTVAVTVPAGGAGAAGQTVDGTAGAAGTSPTGGATFGAYLAAARGTAGGGGGLAVAPANGGGAVGFGTGGNGGVGSATGAAGTAGTTSVAAPGGGGGGGVTTAPASTAGGNGGVSNFHSGTIATGGAVNTAGNAGAASPLGQIGSGGSGGGGSTTGAGGKGGDGGTYGTGGGGGGAALNGNASGGGGAGASGVCIVTTYF